MINQRTLYFPILVFVLLALSLSANAQVHPIDIMDVQYGQSVGNGDKQGFTDINIYGLLPIVTRKDKAIISFPYFTYNSIENSELDLPGNNFYQLSFPIAMQTSISSNKNLGFFVLPTLSSDLSSTDKKNFNFSGAVFLGNNPASSFVFRYGIYYSYYVNGQLLIPVFNYYWTPTERFRINGSNPLNPKISYRLAPKYRIGLEFDYRTKLYNLSQSNNDRYVSDTRGIIAPYADINITEKLVVNIKGGYAFKNKIEVYEGVNRNSSWFTGFKDREALKSQSQKGWFVKGGIKLQITPSLN